MNRIVDLLVGSELALDILVSENAHLVVEILSVAS